MKWRVGWIGVLFAAVIGCRGVMAHPVVRCAAQLKVEASGHATVSVRFDVLAFVLNEDPAKEPEDAVWALIEGQAGAAGEALESAGQRLARHVVLRVDGSDLRGMLRAFPDASALEKWKRDVRVAGERPRLPWVAEAVIVFEFGLDAREAAIQFPEVMGDLVLLVETPGAEARAIPLRAGEWSPAIALGESAERKSAAGNEYAAARGTGFLSFVRMGVEHIVPQGLDHMLFILGLFLASPKMKSLLVMVTMFTLAHSVTLALAATGVVVAPPRVIEPLIALSIVGVAVENIWRRPKAASGDRPQGFSFGQDAVRAGIVFAFGLVHGLGFASAFKEMELPRSVLVPALVGFNVGVEVGQLLVLSCAFVLIGWAGRRSWYRSVVVVPGSVVIACVGLYWAVTRVVGA